jgi:hypothetical protein
VIKFLSEKDEIIGADTIQDNEIFETRNSSYLACNSPKG